MADTTPSSRECHGHGYGITMLQGFLFAWSLNKYPLPIFLKATGRLQHLADTEVIVWWSTMMVVLFSGNKVCSRCCFGSENKA